MSELSAYDKSLLTLDNCDREPIHIPGSIQTFGVLLAGPLDLSEITYCSTNSEEFLGLSPQDLLGSAFSEHFERSMLHDLRNLASLSTARTQRERAGHYALPKAKVEVYLHVTPNNQIVVELEPADNAEPISGASPIDQMRKFLSAAGGQNSLKRMLNICVAGLSELTGFDRVMAYRYEANGDGEVVAESLLGTAESFLGLRYPAWDVPAQARALQVKNPLRMLVDVQQSPVKLLALRKDAAPLDISLAHLRGISPIHVEYLSNMGVGASLTIGLVVDGKLWGMFSCHHKSPKVVTSDVRIAVELFGQMISLIIKQKLDLEDTLRRGQAAEARERILAETNAKTDFLSSFQELAPILSKVVPCNGIAVTYEGKSLTYGSTPGHDAISALASYRDGAEDIIHVIGSLSKDPLTASCGLSATAGALLIRATAAYPMQLLFFRDEVTRSLNWAGKPEKALQTGPYGARISPRGSFEAFVEDRRGYADPWTEADLAAARELQILVTQISAKSERVQLMRHQDLISHQRQQDLMIAELNHRVKNILALIRSLSRQAKSSSASLESYALALENRIAALAAAHDLAVSNTMRGVSLRGLLDTELAPFLADKRAQIVMSGNTVGLRADVAPMIALVLHEVVSNAVKYGALSMEDGVVEVQWETDDKHLRFLWREVGGPPVEAPKRRGFGRSLVENAIPFELDGDAHLTFDPAGVRFEFSLPLECLVELEGDTPVRVIGSVALAEKVATGRTALLVEDNVVLAMDMVETLSRLGAEHVEAANTVQSGLKALKDRDFDFAILDLNLRGQISFEIAHALAEAEVPFAFVTGYGSTADMPPDLRERPILTKPIDEGTLSACIEKLLV